VTGTILPGDGQPAAKINVSLGDIKATIDDRGRFGFAMPLLHKGLLFTRLGTSKPSWHKDIVEILRSPSKRNLTFFSQKRMLARLDYPGTNAWCIST
jgi:hypothetical protein